MAAGPTGCSDHWGTRCPGNYIRRVVGGDHLQRRAAVPAEDDVQDVQGIAHGAGHHDPADAGDLVVDRVEPGHPAAPAEVVRVRAGIKGAHRHHEPQPVHRGEQTTAPQPGHVDPGLGGDQPGVRRGESRCPDIVLRYVGQSVPGQSGVARLDDRGETQVAALGDEHRSHRRGQVTHP